MGLRKNEDATVLGTISGYTFSGKEVIRSDAVSACSYKKKLFCLTGW